LIAKKLVFYIESFAEHSILLKFKEGDNKGLGSWFTVPGSWLKEITRNYKPGTRNQVFK
jgi:hypothetical protein